MPRRCRLNAALSAVGLIIVLGTAGCGGSKGSLPAVPGKASSGTARSAAEVSSATLTVRSSSDAFVDSVGVNVHLADGNTAYGNPGTLRNALKAFGLRHVRDGLGTQQPNLCGLLQSLSANGIHLDLEADPNASVIPDQLSCGGSAVESIEGPNELDLSGDPNWVADLRSTMTAIAATQSGRYPIIAPGLTSESAFAQLSGIGSLVNEGSFHDYFAGRNPETGGWGGTNQFGTYGSLQFNIAVAQQSTGAIPMVSTESGYSDSAEDYAVPPPIKLAYTLRLLLHHWNAGVVRSYLYELFDEGSQPFSHYGLADGNGAAKPVGTALGAFLAHLSDPGSAFTPQSYGASVNAPSDVESVLLGKRDGTYELIYWTTDQQWDPDRYQTLAPVSQQITVNFPAAPRALHWTSFQSDGNAFDGALGSGSSVTLTAWGTPTILDITP